MCGLYVLKNSQDDSGLYAHIWHQHAWIVVFYGVVSVCLCHSCVAAFCRSDLWV